MRSETATYLYCILGAAEAPDAGRAPQGLPHAGATRAVAVDRGLWMLVAEVPRNEYGPERIEAGLKDLDWVSRCALAHESVVEAFLEGGDLVPLKLFTLFDGEERARAYFREKRSALEAVLRRISGCREWSVRCARAKAQPSPARAAKPTGEGAGREFLLRKRREIGARQMPDAKEREQVEAALAELSALGAEHCRNPVQEGLGSRLIADAAILVRRDAEARFCARADELGLALRPLGLELAITGPWPAYHFSGEAR